MSTKPITRNLSYPKQRTFSDATGNLLSVFGPAKWTDTDQASAPGEQRTRLVKDILRVGDWLPDCGPWQVTPELLAEITGNTTQFIRNGNKCILCKTHDPRPGVHPDDFISEIDALAVVGDTLYATTYVTPAQAAYLRQPTMTVSVQEVSEWTDGAKNVYGPLLLHVAVVDLPIIPGQERFADLSKKPPRRLSKMAVDFNALVDVLGRLMTAMGGSKLPDGITEDTLVPTLEGVVSAMGGGGSTEPDPATPIDPASVGGMDEMSKNLSKLIDSHPVIRSLSKTLADTQKELADRKAAEAVAAKTAFTAKLDSLCAAGNIDAAKRTEIEKNGQRLGYDMALLEGYETARMVNMGRTSKQFATAADPAGQQGGRTQEQYEADMKAKGLTPVKIEEL